MCQARLSKILKVDRPGELFSYAIGEDALKLAQMMDGKLLLVTSVADLNPEQVIARYKLRVTNH